MKNKEFLLKDLCAILKECPKGMELDCTIFDTKVIYQGLSARIPTHPIVVQTEHGFEFELTQYGQTHNIVGSKCVIFPKGENTWEGFHRPFKDGDIIYVCDEYSDATFTYLAILKQIEKGGKINSHCFYNYEDDVFSTNDFLYDSCNIRFATEEEKERLFKAIKDNGYRWDAETKTLEKTVKPKFQVGDRIKHIVGREEFATIISVEELHYNLDSKVGTSSFSISLQHEWELVPNKFDINSLKPFDKVLVRDNNEQLWLADLFGFYRKTLYPFMCVGHYTNQCIPYEGNEHLLGTSDECDEYYKNWE